MINYGYVIKINNDSYVVHVDPEQPGSGYAVVPKDLDTQNKYDINDVRIYYEKNPQYRMDESHLLVDVLSEDNLTAQELADRARAQRDTLLREVVDSMNPMRWEAMTDTQKDAWRAYRQALLDVPQQEGFPMTIVWPEVPDD